MNAYLFSAGCTTTQVCPTPDRRGQVVDQLQTWDSCASAVIYGGDAEQAQKRFEDWLSAARDPEHPPRVKIKRMVAAQLVDHLLTESGDKPLEWPQISQQVNDGLVTTSPDDFEQGYWVDINQTLPPRKTHSDTESLKRDLPADVRDGLNWSPDKKFFFLVSVLSPSPARATAVDDPEAAPSGSDSAEDEIDASEEAELEGYILALLEMRDKEAAALVQARNSVIAAWLWRKYAAGSRLAMNDIHVAPCCSFVPVE